MNIDWSQLVTKAVKDAAAIALALSVSKADLLARNVAAVVQIARIQDRIDTLGYGIYAGEATKEDEAEQTALKLSIAAWKSYKFQLGGVTLQIGWPSSTEWSAEPFFRDCGYSTYSGGSKHIAGRVVAYVFGGVCF